MSLAAIDQAVTQPQPGARMPARFSVAQFDAMIDAGVFSAETDRQIQLPTFRCRSAGCSANPHSHRSAVH